METTQLLRDLAQKYNTPDFVKDDPLQFPHRFKDKRDVEVSALLSQWIAYGNRVQIIATLEKLHALLGASPFDFIASKAYEEYRQSPKNLYRFYTYGDFFSFCEHLHRVLVEEGFSSVEAKLLSMRSNYTDALSVLENLIALFPNQKGIPKDTHSACKRLCLLLRWLVRSDGVADLGLWHLLPQSELLIPLDTHVFRLARELHLTERKQADMKTALEITHRLREVFPTDPALGDFALFGYGVNQAKQ